MAKKKRKIKPKKKITHKKPQPAEEFIRKTRIRVIGIGGGGGSIVSEIAPHVKRVDFIAANTDTQALKEVGKKARIFQFGQRLTRGLGCGMDPKIGQKAAVEAKQKITNLFKGTDLAILVVSLGGGTGSGSAPEFAKIAKELGVMVFGIFTLPFKFEGLKRAQIARSSLEKLTPNLNAFSVIPNENIFKIINKDTPVIEAFSAVNNRLSENLRGLIEIIYLPGLINIDFADIRTILEGKGKLAYLNSSTGQGQNRAEEALKELLNSPLNEYTIEGAEKILFDITASKKLAMNEVELISRTISDFNRRAKIIFGVSQDNDYNDKLRITLLAIGCGKEPEEKPEKKIEPKPQSKLTPKLKKKKPKPAIRKRRVLPARLKGKPKKIKIKIKHKIKKRVAPAPSPAEISVLTRKSGLDLKKEEEKIEKEILEEEKKWDIPAFLRRQQER